MPLARLSSRAHASSRRQVGVLMKAGVLLALTGIAGIGTGTSAFAASSVLPTPKAPVTLPTAVEPLQPYVPQNSCDPRIKPGVKKFRNLMLATYKTGYDGGSTRACAGAGVSEHVEGRAWDWMLPVSDAKDKKVADGVIAWLLKKGPDGTPALEARRLGIMYVMYDHRIWGTWDTSWQPIRKGNDQHTSHVHFSFSWAGAEGHTSFWTGKVGKVDYGPCAVYAGQPAVIRTKFNPEPCSTNLPAAPRSTHAVAEFGSSGAGVHKAEALLAMPAASRTSTFGTTVWKAVIAYQQAHHLPVTGQLDKDTWVSLDPASTLAPLKKTPAKKTTSTSSSGNATAPVPTTSSTWVTVKPGSSGAEVTAVQTALKMAAANRTGYFGTITLAAVKAFQKAHGLSVDGVVGPITAKALGLVH